MSILFIWLVTVWLIVMATLRFINPPKIDGEIMLIVSGLCLIFNFIQMSVLHSKDMHEFAHAPGTGCGHDHDHGDGHGHDHHHDHDHNHDHNHDDSHDHHHNHDHDHDHDHKCNEKKKQDD